jgi:peptidoglycan hydrolase-like protein with peptidoglycan-binding domain
MQQHNLQFLIRPKLENGSLPLNSRTPRIWGGPGKSSMPAMGMSGGAGSEQVRSAQKALEKGMDPGPIDGVMGPKTMAALKAFQKDQKLSESGRLDDQTREKLGVSR